ncbi:hypothetical protein Msil_1750 [Methylocella silvestris BL2]|uniref:DUF4436 domain-containing protein n=2 Tax=Methylocella silvestris TaxID=199596 RepID=B8ELR5_METSB|nr:hypothetical protein Msil_1750 [Methylocella silvestris BL2]
MRRVLAISLALVAIFAAYMAFFAGLCLQPETSETAVAESLATKTAPLNIFLEATQVDPVRQAISISLDFSTEAGPRGAHYPALPDRDITVHASDGDYVLDIVLGAGSAAPTTIAQIGVNGSISAYPFDEYRGEVTIAAWEGKKPEGERIPIRLTLWERLAGWEIDILARAPAPGEVGLGLEIRAKRPLAQIYFASLVYAVMAVIALCGLTIGVLAIAGLRRLEAALTGALAAMLFAVPALRNVMPGAPPLGVKADAFVFLSAQMALMIGLAFFIIAWARRGPAP